MNRLFSGAILIFAIGLMIPLDAFAATPTETVESGVNRILKTLSDPAFKAKPKEAKIAEIGNIVGVVKLQGITTQDLPYPTKKAHFNHGATVGASHPTCHRTC